MITGHLGAALAARSRWRSAPLFWLLAASVAQDGVDTLLAAAGVCNPWGLYTHTVPATAVIAAGAGGFVLLVTGGGSQGRTAALVTAALVFLHLPLDYITGNKLYWPGGELHGLRLYERPLLDFLVETSLLTAGWLLLRRARPVPRLAMSRAAFLVALAVQGAADLSTGRGFKMSACEREAPTTMGH